MGQSNPFVLVIVCAVLITAAIIDGWKLKVPNWLTLPFIAGGWAYWCAVNGWSGLGYTLGGSALGLALLLGPYVIGGMGAGDVKLFAGVGAWLGPGLTLRAFCVSAVVGGFLALLIVLARAVRMRKWSIATESWLRFRAVTAELMLIRDPKELSALAAARKPTALLLPYAIPLALGTVGYLAWLTLL